MFHSLRTSKSKNLRGLLLHLMSTTPRFASPESKTCLRLHLRCGGDLLKAVRIVASRIRSSRTQWPSLQEGALPEPPRTELREATAPCAFLGKQNKTRKNYRNITTQKKSRTGLISQAPRFQDPKQPLSRPLIFECGFATWNWKGRRQVVVSSLSLDRDPDACSIHLNIATCQWWFPLILGVEKATCFKWLQNGDHLRSPA